MRVSRRQATQRLPPTETGGGTLLEDPQDFLDRTHPENDQYMQGIEHVQRQIMHQTTMLRPKQVKMLKSVFAGNNYIDTGKLHHAHAATVSRLANSEKGQRLLNLLQYHLKLIEGPNEAQRRALLWRIAAANEHLEPKTSIQATSELNKMHFQQEGPKDAPPPQVVININQDTMPKGPLDR